jgi:hypothetical protein
MENVLHLDLVKSNKAAAAIVSRTVAMLKLAALKAAAHQADPKTYPLPADPSSFERILAARLASRPAAAQQRAAARAHSLLGGTVDARTRAFGDLGKLDVRSAKPIAELASTPLALDKAQLTKLATFRLADELIAAGAPKPPPPPSPPAAGKLLKVRIHRVICEDETDPEPFGDDEIGMGGVTIDETGDVHKVPAFTVGTSFDDHEQRIYNPPKTFASFDLTEGGSHWPKSYALSIYLSELDNGGFPGFLQDLMNEAKKWVSALVNGWIPGLGTLLGVVLDVFVGWLVALWEDDLFPAITIQTDIKSPQHVFASGTRTSGMKKYWTQAHGGKYWIWLDWQITT